jgi:hypothetical protein
LYAGPSDVVIVPGPYGLNSTTTGRGFRGAWPVTVAARVTPSDIFTRWVMLAVAARAAAEWASIAIAARAAAHIAGHRLSVIANISVRKLLTNLAHCARPPGGS